MKLALVWVAEPCLKAGESVGQVVVVAVSEGSAKPDEVSP